MPKYPKIGNRYPKDKVGGKCAICEKEGADWKIDVQTNWFRGDDEVFLVHKSCIKGKRSNELLSLLVNTDISDA